MSRIKNLIIIIFILLSSIGYAQSAKLTDIIAPIKLIAGRPDTVLISDIFYSDDYNISIQKTNGIQADYLEKELKLVITADAKTEGVSVLNFKLKNKIYSIPLFVRKINNQTLLTHRTNLVNRFFFSEVLIHGIVSNTK